MWCRDVNENHVIDFNQWARAYFDRELRSYIKTEQSTVEASLFVNYQTIKAIVYYSVLFYLISDVPRCDLSLRNLLMFAFSLAVRYDLRLKR